ncbi:hypothetical protein PVAND_010769 [Polypedilum vanderplanki]|uniref:Polypeptide N-acetylgalactosaminyltransferase n=1 Tax=Polypedilum vanderplanki TaxID=319348 RepID=A0A9J6CGL1_POLVA|nr:hypothetical protein PVAND_010769 [Polypedilum vanderplanki]
MLKLSQRKIHFSFVCATSIVICIIVLQYLSYNDDFIENDDDQSEERLIDYNNYALMEEEKTRIGAGEHGKPVILENQDEIKENERLYNQTGFYVIASNKISVNRSIPDLRSTECRAQKYSSVLPKVSIVIIFYNEVFSMLKRTLHSIYNRSPLRLIREIVLVNDASTESELYNDLKKYVKKNFGKFVKIKNLKERKGLIVARMEGARIAKGEILVFLDAHVEVNHNWLPALITPIKENRKLATVPLIDDFSSTTFEYFGMVPTRGVFDWMFTFREIKLKNPDTIKSFQVPIMLGCAFAIDRKFFLNDLQGYDEGLQIWNGENYELSFKLHLCADGILKIPCSRVAHTFREINPTRAKSYDYVASNFKRIAEVWLDEYKEILYSRQPQRFEKAKAGDLTKAKKVKDSLNCKPFKYFLDVVAKDLVDFYPPLFQIPVFASGAIKSLASEEKFCLTGVGTIQIPLRLAKCDTNLIEPRDLQHFSLTFFKQIIQSGTDLCLDASNLSIIDCHYDKGNQFWRLEEETGLLKNNNDHGKFCMTADINEMRVVMEICDENNSNQKWTFGYVNATAMRRWNEIYGYKIM